MATKAAYKRLSKEYVAMQKEPPPFVWAAPDEKDILTWNFIIHGPPDSPYVGGEYHGVLLFPSEYPFKPPGIKMYTPSGRFQPDKKICFSMSDFHPGSWNPAWSVATILTGLVSFMLSDEMTTGSVTTSDTDKRVYASRSHTWNLQHRRFREAFPEYCTPSRRRLPNMGETERGLPDTDTSPESSDSATTAACLPLIPTPKIAQPPIAIAVPKPAGVARPRKGRAVSTTGAGDGRRGWAATWREVVWDKWRWGVLIALAVVVSRITSST
ncbi:ubiquitin-conjugating enzyme E2 6 [Russula dissimulans]|nr:ubiquitin-conjugating enzyme E2 6 [Russula dissimulans]